MNNSIHNIKDYKQALVYSKDIEKVLTIVKATQASLRSYEHYVPVQHILASLTDERLILEIYLDQFKEVIKNKGKKRT